MATCPVLRLIPFLPSVVRKRVWRRPGEKFYPLRSHLFPRWSNHGSECIYLSNSVTELVAIEFDLLIAEHYLRLKSWYAQTFGENIFMKYLWTIMQDQTELYVFVREKTGNKQNGVVSSTPVQSNWTCLIRSRVTVPDSLNEWESWRVEINQPGRRFRLFIILYVMTFTGKCHAY